MLASAASAGLARTLLAARLRKWDYSHLADDALLITDELVANAAKAASGRQIKMRASRDATGVFIGVWDPSDQLPVLRPMAELTLETLDLAEDSWDDNGGRGLHIVRALATDSGCTPTPSGGKWLWAHLKAF